MEYNNNSDCPSVTQSLKEAEEVYIEVINGILKLDKDILKRIDRMKDNGVHKPFIRAAYFIMIACFTMEDEDIENASKAVDELSKLSNKFRRNSFLDKMIKLVKTPNYKEYTDMEAHAEMIHCYSIALKAVICAINAYNFYGLIKVIYRLRKFMSTFESSKTILRKKTEWESEESRQCYEAGIQLTKGLCHLAISSTPPKILKLINMFGYRGVESVAFRCLNKAAFDLHGVYSEFARLILVGYWVYIQPHLAPFYSKDLEFCGRVLEAETQKYPDSIVFKIFDTKLDQISGRIDKAIARYETFLTETKSMAHKAFHFELVWCYALNSNWRQALKYAELVRTGAPHSPTFTTYMEAVFRYVVSQEDNEQDMKDKATELFRLVPTLRLRHLGKTITPEKIAVYLSEQYLKNELCLILPEMELFYQGNWIYFIQNNTELLERLMAKVNREQDKHKHELDGDGLLDNYLVTVFQQGVILKMLGKLDEAKHCFDTILVNEERIDREFSLAPQCMCEIGLIELECGRKEEAKRWLTTSLEHYSHYYNENYVHVRAYSGLRELGVNHSEQSADQQKLQQYQTEWIKENELDKSLFDKIMEKEEKLDQAHMKVK